MAPSQRSAPPTGAAIPPQLAFDRVLAAQRRAAGMVKRTPLISAGSLSDRLGGPVLLKAESLQRTGSFKLRGALSKIHAVEGESRGVVAGSAGNHAQSLAYAARASGLPCEIHMPVNAAASKVTAVRAFGATVHRHEGSVDDCVASARQQASEQGLTFVSPFDDYDVIAGQAGLGVELLEDVPDLAAVVVPVGGGGLASGVAIAIKQRRPEVAVIGVQAAACAAFPESLRRHAPVAVASHVTIADGIAIKRPGELTLPLIEHWLDDLVTVAEEWIAEAMVLLVERSKLVVEGAGAAAPAALLAGEVRPPRGGTTVAVLSGGNVDIGLIAAIAARHETTAGRRVRLFTRISDRPGGLARLLAAVAEANGNVIGVEHVRDGVDLGVRETGIELTVETQGRDHLGALLDRLREVGYEVAVERP